MSRLRRASMLVLLSCVSACAKPRADATQVMVVVDAEPGVRSRAGSLELLVRTLPDDVEVHRKVLLASLNELVLPYTLALIPQGGDASRRYEVLAVVRDGDGRALATARIQSHYVAKRKLRLPLWLRDDCIGVECMGAQTCMAGQCTGAVVDPGTLAPFEGDSAPPAISIKSDAGSDGGVDAGDPCPNGHCPCIEGTSRFCDGTDQGECERGTQKCIGQRWQPCQGTRSSSPEICNGLDDDCNGNKDDFVVCDLTQLVHSREAMCLNGACVSTLCEAFWADCNQDARDGCERSLTSADSCVSCDSPCQIDHAASSCESGECRVVECDADWADCDGDRESCETPTDTEANCGECGEVCEFDNGVAHCGGVPGSRACELYQCDPGFDDCDANAETGCEADLATDTHNCGGCGNDCADRQNIDSASCEAGLCRLVCNAGFVDCDGDRDNGCEHELSDGPCIACLQNISNVDPSRYNFNNAPVVDFSCGVTQTFDSTSRTWSSAGPQPCCGGPCPDSSSADPQSGGASIVVLRATRLTVGPTTTVRVRGSRPVMFAVQGDATIAGVVDASAAGDVPGAGGSSTSVNNGQCSGATGRSATSSTSGGGGGGFASPGGNGGSPPAGSAVAGGSSLGDSDLSPLYAGCAGGTGHVSSPCTGMGTQLGGAGGGAIQFAVAGTLSVSGTLLANGGAAPAPCSNYVGSASRAGGNGGGSGGSILLEAAAFQIDSLSLHTQVSGGAGSTAASTSNVGVTTDAGEGGPGDESGEAEGGGDGAYAASASGGSPAGGGGGGGYGRVLMRSCLE